MVERCCVGSRLLGLRWLLQTICVVLVLASGCIAGFAQSGTGTIQGTVTDASGALVPQAAIHVVNTANGQVHDTKANRTGFYSVPGLFAGTYTITVSAPEMNPYKTSIDLLVAQTAVENAKLTMGAVTQKVNVNAQTIQLATYENGTISTTLDNARINQLPMNGRNLLTLTAMTTPGLEGNGNRANGLMSSGIEYVQDGAPITNRDLGGPASQADPDAIQEVKIETSASNAMYALPATAVITTKSGTNHLHGSLFETARNNALGLARTRANPSNFVAPRLIRNEFGASVGGPIVIPRLYHGQDKSFFFVAV